MFATVVHEASISYDYKAAEDTCSLAGTEEK